MKVVPIANALLSPEPVRPCRRVDPFRDAGEAEVQRLADQSRGGDCDRQTDGDGNGGVKPGPADQDPRCRRDDHMGGIK